MNSMPNMRLDQCCTIVSGATPSTAIKEYWDGDVLWATPKDLSALTGPQIAETPRKITKAGLASCGASILPAGSVLFSSRAPIGHVAINTVPMATNQGFKSFIPRPEYLIAGYLFHWLRCHRSYLERLGNGATFKEVSKAVVARVEVPIPSLPEQRRIAAILDQAEALRAKRCATLAQLDELVRAIFVDMFGHLLNGAHYAHSLPLAKLCIIAGQYGSGSASTVKTPDKPRYIRITDINEKGSLNSEVVSLHGQPKDWQEFLLEPGDVVFARSGATVGKTYLHTKCEVQCVFAGYLIRFRPDTSKLLPEFLFAFTRSEHYLSWVLARQRVVAQPNISAKQYCYDLRVPIPSLEEQALFRAKIEQVDSIRAKLELSATSQNELFSSLQHRAFAGEL